VAVASAGPYASLHIAPDRQPRQQPTTQFFTGRMPFLPPNQQCQSTNTPKINPSYGLADETTNSFSTEETKSYTAKRKKNKNEMG